MVSYYVSWAHSLTGPWRCKWQYDQIEGKYIRSQTRLISTIPLIHPQRDAKNHVYSFPWKLMQLDQNLLKVLEKLVSFPASLIPPGAEHKSTQVLLEVNPISLSLQQVPSQSSITFGERGLKFSPPWPIDRKGFFLYLNTPFYTLSARTASCTVMDSFLLLPRWLRTGKPVWFLLPLCGHWEQRA